MESISAMILRYVGQNEDVTLDDLEWLEDKSYRDVQKLMKCLIVDGYLLEKKDLLRKFRTLTLTKKGVDFSLLDLPKGNKICATQKTKTEPNKKSKKTITGAFK